MHIQIETDVSNNRQVAPDPSSFFLLKTVKFSTSEFDMFYTYFILLQHNFEQNSRKRENIYIWLYTCVCIYVYVCVCIYIYICVW